MALSSASTVLVPSVLFNLERLIDDLSPGASSLLGCRWSFTNFERAHAIVEYELPEPWVAFAARFNRFSGVRLEVHHGEEDDGIGLVALGQPIVVAVDSFDLPYRPACGRVHSARTIVLEELDEMASAVVVFDAWMPAYHGPVALDVLSLARRSLVPRDDVREPLFAGTPIDKYWWAVSLGEPRGFDTAANIEAALAGLTAEAEATASVSAIANFGATAAQALSSPLPHAFEERRAAALLLRAELGLRAYLLRFFDAAAIALGDALLSAELQRWRTHLADLAFVRDILIKSTCFDRPEYASIAAAAADRAARAEQRFAAFACDRFFPEENAGEAILTTC